MFRNTMWYVYILRCADNSFYTGITKDIIRRVKQHNGEESGAKYTRTRRPVVLVYKYRCRNRTAAMKRELAIKKMTREQKRALIATRS